jgi:hypothetical protein
MAWHALHHVSGSSFQPLTELRSQPTTMNLKTAVALMP